MGNEETCPNIIRLLVDNLLDLLRRTGSRFEIERPLEADAREEGEWGKNKVKRKCFSLSSFLAFRMAFPRGCSSLGLIQPRWLSNAHVAFARD